MDLPWRSLASKVARFNNNGMIDYKSTFEDNEIVFGLMKDDTGGASFTEILYRNKDNLETIFRAIDKDNSGHISMEEFSEACTVLCQHTGTVLTGKEIRNMVKAMDQNNDGQIDFNEFLEAFRIVNHQHDASMMPKRSSSSCTNLSESKLKRIAELPSKKH
ncbi:Serine/threonine-protein phosphatase with EF-hands pef-1 [Lamellibrachia satsuma]|nr:Serine/threonine-protein phosphatase with EF-hands pef-1 [Lamellibrachia satsuma]